MRTDIEAGNSSRPSLGRQVAPEGAFTSDKVDYSHFDTIDLPEASESSMASFRTSKADVDEGTNANPPRKINQTACFTRREKYIVGALFTILAGTTLLLLLCSRNNDTNSQDYSQWTLTGDSLSVEGDGYFGDKVCISDDGSRIAVYTGAVMCSAVTFYDRRVAPAAEIDDENVHDSEIWVQVARLSHNDTGPVVAMSGDGTMIASAYPRSSQPLQTYRLVENKRTGQTELIPVGSGLYWLESQFDDDFGSSVALSKDGTRMVVGAGGTSYGAPGGNYAVVYDLVDGDWAQTGNVLNGIIFYDDDPSSSSRLDLCQENLGAAIAISSNGKRIALAAPSSYVCDLSRAGAVYVYEQDDVANEWMQVGNKIQLEGIVRNDAIGSTLSISDDGSRLAIGTEGKLAAVVELSSETQDWEIVGEVFNLYSEQPAADLLTKGVRVALSGNGMRLALTAPFGGPPSDGIFTTSGYVQVFEYNANDGKDRSSLVWKPVSHNVSFENEFGTTADLSADGTTLVTGWRYDQSGNQTVVFDGAVRVYSAPGAAT
jgi:hypothetical protein